MSYKRFLLMILASTVVMLGLMYLNTYALDHVWFSQTRMWMALVMGATMSILMMAFMWAMYPNKKRNTAITIASAVVWLAALWLVRSQSTVDDVSYMKAMIPHHSIAVLTSSRATIRDPRVRRLADDILRTQVKEIAEMQALVKDLKQHPIPDSAPALPAASVGVD